jgi:hypothetical protein
MNVRITVAVAAPVATVWRALTDPAIVTMWAGVTPVRLAAGYPQPGEHALWRESNGGLLHDLILNVEPERRLTSRLTRGSCWVMEDYLLDARGARATRLRAEWRGHAALALGNDASLRRLKAWCELSRAGRARA